MEVFFLLDFKNKMWIEAKGKGIISPTSRPLASDEKTFKKMFLIFTPNRLIQTANEMISLRSPNLIDKPGCGMIQKEMELFPHFHASDKKPFTKCFPSSTRNCKLIFKTGYGIILPLTGL